MNTFHFTYTTLFHPSEAPKPSLLLQTEAQAIETAKEMSKNYGIRVQVQHPSDLRTICIFSKGERVDAPRK